MAASMVDLENRVRTIEQRSSLGSDPSKRFWGAEYEPSIPPAENVRTLATFNEDGVTTVVLGWIVPDNPEIETFEIWVKGISNEASGVVQLAETREPPATLVLQSDATTAKTLIVRTRMRSGVGSSLNASPTATAEIRKLVVSGASLEDGSVTEQKIANLAVTNAKIGNLAVTDAKIQSLTATKVTAGTLQAGVIYAGQINAVQINVGTLNGFTITAPNIISTFGSNSITLSNGQISITGTNFTQTLTSGTWTVGSNFFSSQFSCTGELLTALDRSGNGMLVMDGGDNNGFQGFYVYRGGFGSERISIRAGTGSNGEIYVNGTRVITNRQSAVSSPSGGATVDAQARTAIDALIARLQAHGLIS